MWARAWVRIVSSVIEKACCAVVNHGVETCPSGFRNQTGNSCHRTRNLCPWLDDQLPMTVEGRDVTAGEDRHSLFQIVVVAPPTEFEKPCYVGLVEPRADRLGGIASDNGIWLDIPGHQSPCADNRTVPDRNTRHNYGLSPDPDVVANHSVARRLISVLRACEGEHL